MRAWARSVFTNCVSDSPFISAPTLDRLLDLSRFSELAGEHFADKSRELFVGGKPQRNSLTQRQRPCLLREIDGQKLLTAELFFEPDDPVLELKRIGPGQKSQHQQGQRDNDPPTLIPSRLHDAIV